MTELITKAKINLKEGIIDLEGTELFVSKYLDEFKDKLEDSYATDQALAISPIEYQSEKQKGKKLSRKVKGVNISPIPVDLKSSKPTLREFYSEKKPVSNQEKVTLFVYYLNKTVDIKNVLPGHIVSCYNEVDERVPLNIPALFRDITNLKGWLEAGSETGSVKTSIIGDNLIKHDLPSDKDDKPNKTTTEK